MYAHTGAQIAACCILGQSQSISPRQVADEWQEYQKRLEYFNEVHRKQTTLIDRLANKVRLQSREYHVNTLVLPFHLPCGESKCSVLVLWILRTSSDFSYLSQYPALLFLLRLHFFQYFPCVSFHRFTHSRNI